MILRIFPSAGAPLTFSLRHFPTTSAPDTRWEGFMYILWDVREPTSLCFDAIKGGMAYLNHDQGYIAQAPSLTAAGTVGIVGNTFCHEGSVSQQIRQF